MATSRLAWPASTRRGPRPPPATCAVRSRSGSPAAARAGLAAGSAGEVVTRWDYPDLDTALRGLLSAGPAVKAIAAAGEEPVISAVTDAVTPFRTGDGRYVIQNTWRHLVATA